MSPETVRSRGRTFARDRRGNVAVMLAVAMVPVLGMIGAGVDYSRSSNHQRKLSRAADAAALAAAKFRNEPLERRRAIAKSAFEESMGMKPGSTQASDGLRDVWVKLTPVENGVRVDVGGKVDYRMAGMFGRAAGDVSAFAEAITVSNPTEVALVLDNTGSMRNDMAALRKAASQFTETLFSNATDDLLKIGVVPYVATVNPGRTQLQLSWLDTGANSKWHGHTLRNRTIAEMTNCNPDPFPKPVVVSDPDPTPSPQPKPQPSNPQPSKPKPDPQPKEQDREPKGKDRVDLTDPFKTFAQIATELFGVSSAQAQVTPRTDTPTIGQNVNPGAPYRTDTSPVIVPDGFRFEGPPCGDLKNPSRISHFDLFDRIDGGLWKGCVEARPEPYDVTDEPPSAFNPNTLFVPYFWPDEPGKFENSRYANSYMDDGPLPPGWRNSDDGDDDGRNFANLFKYNRANRTKIKENGPNTSGPNASCPDEILPLTNQKSVVVNKVSKLQHWDGGGTISSEGLMWGWRVLSPGAPFTEGAPYDPKNKKYLVLMSDGMNSFVGNQTRGPTKSDYTAYGYLRDGRLPSDWFSKGEDYLDSRMRLACGNIKATGIKIMTILFRETDPGTVQLMKDCASENRYAYYAANETELRRAFDELAGEISRLRLTK